MSKIPSDATIKADRVVAEGEATGHAHRVLPGTATLYQAGGDLYLDAPDGAEVGHEEHRRIGLPPGQYACRRVLEFDHVADEARGVMD